VSADELLARLLLDIGLVVVVAQLLRLLLARLHQPRVLAEVLAGIMLGPTLLGHLPGDPTAFLFPDEIRSALGLIGALGLAIFAFAVGLELDLASLRQRSRVVASVSLGALALPFAVGVGLAVLIYGSHDFAQGQNVPALAFTLFMATSMAVTAFPVLVAILEERGIRRSPLGELAVGSAALQDVAGWILLATALAVLSGQGTAHIVRVMVTAVAFVAALAFVARPLLRAGLSRYRPTNAAGNDLLAIAIAYAIVCAGITQLIGVHTVLGAFAAGVTFPRDVRQAEPRALTRAILPITFAILLPIYFLTPGLAIDAGAIGSRGMAELALIVAAACTAKFLGAGIPARRVGMTWDEAMPLAVLLNTRGLMELVVLSVGYAEGVLDQRLFSELVLMAVITTLLTGPLLDVLRRRGMVAAGDRKGTQIDEWEEPTQAAPEPAAI
jgi:K+:H+ antiporter